MPVIEDAGKIAIVKNVDDHEDRILRLETLEGGGGGAGGGVKVLWAPLWWGGAVIPLREWYTFRWMGLSGTVIGWTLLSACSNCSLTVDIVKMTYANYDAAWSNKVSICGGNEPSVTATDKNQDSTLTGWSTGVTDGDIWGIETIGVSGQIFRADLLVRVDT